MRCLIPLMMAACAAAGDSDFGYEKIVAVEVYGFGLSHHSTQDRDWNEKNYGLGIGLAARDPGETFEAIAVAATYRDSFDEQAYLLHAGVRKTFGDFDGLHASISGTIGILNGSGNTGASFIPVASVGYDWLDLCVTYIPSQKQVGMEYRSSDPEKTNLAETSVVALFVKIRLCEF
jgi:hypothetical protein